MREEYLNSKIKDCKKIAKSKEGLCLSNKYLNNSTKLLWKCKFGHTWEATYANIRKGTWCRICSKKIVGLKRRTPIEYFKNYAISRKGICLSDSYINQKSTLQFQCSKGHFWNCSGGSIKGNETWCPICAGTYKADTPELEADRINELRQIAKNHEGECLSANYVNQKTKLQFRCKNGHLWWTIPMVIKKGHWCKKCATKIAGDSQRDNLELFKKIIEDKGGRCLSTEYLNQQTKIFIECQKGHRWFSFPGHLKRGIWCRKCAGSAPHELLDIIKLAESRGGKCLSTEYKNDMTKVIWQCSENHIWEATPNNIKRGKWCPTCSSGIGERVCRLCFEKIFNDHFNKVRPKWLRNTSGFILELDGYSDKLKLAFEHQGTQHYNLKTNHRFIKKNLKKNDREKIKICNQKGITIIFIPEVFTLTKLNHLVSFILTELDRLGVPYPAEACKIILNPKEVYTYTKTKEVEAREQRALQILEIKGASLIDIFRINSGVKVTVKCKNNHISTIGLNTIFNGTICKHCS